MTQKQIKKNGLTNVGWKRMQVMIESANNMQKKQLMLILQNKLKDNVELRFG